MESKQNSMTKSKRLKIPEVRMTKTARMRLLKANPLIKSEIERTNNTDLEKNLNLNTVSRINKSIVDRYQPVVSKEDKKQEIVKKDVSSKKSENNITNKMKVQSKQLPHKVAKQPNNLRRSVSAPRLNRKIETIYETDRSHQEMSNTSVSVENLSKVTHNKMNHSHIFKTPSDRRYSGFAQSSSCRKSLFNSTPSAPTDLRKRLSDWLERRNKKPDSFKHLKCFGVHKINVISEDNKENVNTSTFVEHGSFEDLKIDNPEHNLDETSLIIAPSDLKRVVKGALSDLHCLISEAYPKEQCEAWLTIIRNKCPEVVEDPQYWECRALIEQMRGDIGSAVECYKTAIVQGAEITSVEQSLDHLLQKFKLLEIDTPNGKNSVSTNTKTTVQDFKNVFTSMVIKFAIQEKKLRTKSDKELSQLATTKILVTPVRRSTRLNRSAYTSTPGVQVCSSLKDIDQGIKEQMMFQGNPQL